MKKRTRFNPIFFGIALIVAAVLLILDGVGVGLGAGVGPVRIILGVAFLGWMIDRLIYLDVPGIFFPLGFLFITFKEPLIRMTGANIRISNWTVLLAALLLTIGFYVLLPKRNKISSGNVNVGNRIGTSNIYIDAGELGESCVSNILGFANVFFTNKDAYTGGGTIIIRENAGNITLHVPSDWYVATQISDNVGNVYVPEQRTYGDKSINIRVTDNVGKVSVKFVN
ncbi:MAG: hypothetical protein IJT91_00780 [Clostridia bacterium]|nr:hypothetical protein [Clostridia bacterium]